MSKKYVPSGYQIINIDVSDKTSGTPFTPETEDEKLLYEILTSEKFRKPILLQIYGSDYSFNGFGVICDDTISLTYGAVGASITETIIASGGKLEWQQNEE